MGRCNLAKTFSVSTYSYLPRTQKNGYKLEKSDKVKLAVELMNELERPQDPNDHLRVYS
jgi:hypothetical protein